MGDGAMARSRSDDGVDGRVLPLSRGGVGCWLVTAVKGLIIPAELCLSKPELQDWDVGSIVWVLYELLYKHCIDL